MFKCLKLIMTVGTHPSIFMSIAPVLLDWSNKASWVFPTKLKTKTVETNVQMS